MYKKTKLRLAAALAAVSILSGCLPVFAAEAERNTPLPENTVKADAESSPSDNTAGAFEESPPPDNTVRAVEESSLSENAVRAVEESSLSENAVRAVEESSPSENTVSLADETVFPVPEEPPAFQVYITFRAGSYIGIGTFTDFTPDMTYLQTMYSLDGNHWEDCIRGNWNLPTPGTDDEEKLRVLQNQPCLYDGHEPLKSYIAKKIDRFYVKLRITRQNGLSYDTQAAVVERGGLRPIPEGTTRFALFPSAVAVSEPDPANPRRRRKYARYQFTVSPDATAEEIAALLPDTVPVEVQLDNGPDFMAVGVVDCPVTWKPLFLPALTAGESITIPDAAEEIYIPAGTSVTTPLGTFKLDEPLRLDTPPSTDEVRLVLNVTAEDRNPAGALRAGRDGLELSFYYKPTGALSIQAYVLSQEASKWEKLQELSLSDTFDQPSSANSGYTLVLRNDQEPYRSYLAAANAEETPLPFFVGLEIKGGIYDGRQLVLPWPDTYEHLPDLPQFGAGGNEGNAGASNKGDSTEGGQRPGLPQTPDNSQPGQDPAPNDNQEEQPTNPPQTADGRQKEQPQVSGGDDGHNRQPSPASPPDNGRQRQPISNLSDPDAQPPELSESGQRPELSQTMQDTAQSPLVAQAASDVAEEQNDGIPPTDKAAVRQTPKSGSHTPLFLVAVIIAAAIGIATAARKLSGYPLTSRITGKFRNLFRRE